MLQNQSVPVNFIKGLDTKTDPYQVSLGNFLTLTNSVFTTAGRLTKRNGFSKITTLPNAEQTTLTTLNDNLIATGSNLYAYNADSNIWNNQGIVQPVSLDTLSLVRVSTSQSSPDTALSDNGLCCLVYVDNSLAYYQISDSVTGQQVISRTALPSTATNPRVFTLGRYFIITFMATVSAATHLQYIAIPIANLSSPSSATDLSTSVAALTTGYDGVIANNNLYISWTGSGTTVKTTLLSSTLGQGNTVSIASHTATLMSVTADTSASTAVIWLSFYDGTNTYAAAYNQSLSVVLATTQIVTGVSTAELTSLATNGVLTVYYEVNNNYNTTGAYPTSNIKTHYVSKVTITQAGSVGSPAVVLRSVGLASKAFYGTNGTTYMLVAYGPPGSPTLSQQPTYFLMDSSGNIIMKLAYSNGAGYAASLVLPNVSYLNNTYYIPYLLVDFLATTNKQTNLPANSQVNAIYTQTGISLAKISINSSGQYSSEIANALQLTGGQVWEYDGVKPVELGFHVWPENIANTTTTTTGNLSAQIYFYQFTYEWTDNQGNLHRSAPSVPYEIDLSGTGTSTNKNTLYVPTLRLTYKTSPNPVRIVGYRWSTAQQTYYQFTSLTSPTVNDPTVDYVTIVDTLADSAILGNNIIYTTGGVIENIAPPAAKVSTLYKDRMFVVDSEDQNLLWYSKQVLQSTPVEFSDLFTIYVAPTIGAQGSTGPIEALSAMDDKLIIFKKDAIYYITGDGPNNTGAQNDFSEPVFITASVGCANQNSIVLMPNGLMFQSDKGIWLLGRDLSTNYIGAGVEAFNSQTVQSAQAIPGTNQVRFILNTGTTLMYDYYYNQWGTFTNISAISSTLYQSVQTYLNSFGQIFQETENTYTDGASPVLMSFTTSWINLAGLQGFQRLRAMYLLGTYITPFKLNVQIAYDYNPSPIQNVLIQPDNFAPNYATSIVYGGGQAYAGPGNVFQPRVFNKVQKCESFQLTFNEVYDSSKGIPAGQGFSLSGLNLIIGVKKGYRNQKASQSFG